MEKFNKLFLALRPKAGCLLLLLFPLLLKAGGGWTQQKGKGYFKLSEWWIVFDQHYTDVGLIDPNVTTGVFNTFLYAEYGLTDRITGIANVAVFSRNYMNNLVSSVNQEVLIQGEGINAFGDTDIGAKIKITKPESKLQVASMLLLGLPTGSVAKGSAMNLQTGDGEFNQTLQVDAGIPFSLSDKMQTYSNFYMGFNNRTKGFSEEIRYGAEVGAGLFSGKLWLIGRAFGVESLKNGDTGAALNSTSIFANNTEYTSIAAEVAYYIGKRFGLSVGFATAVKGEVIAAAPSYSAGIFLDTSR